MSLYLLTALLATAQAAITLHPNGDTSYCLDGRKTDIGNNPVITHTYVVPHSDSLQCAADRKIPL